ncbi:hypothetical protein GRI75_13080 [Altererythrobacter soli]|uniref:Uncharacterized protein n=1 Tax=Croceibacterium soli TaxID=1739690 RepID=A0A6I4UUH1_9SPHN|nr:hypothetical protein [Croceibacterium soli]
MQRRKRSVARVFAWPLALFAATIAGLVLGLTGEGWRDAAAWLLLGSVPAVMIFALMRPR